MSLSKLRAKAPARRGREYRSIEVDGAPLRFRVPIATDFYPSRDRLSRLETDYPDLSAEMRYIVLLMAKGYQMDAEDQADPLTIDSAFADLAVRDHVRFGALTAAYQEKFPEAFGATVEADKDTADPSPNGADSSPAIVSSTSGSTRRKRASRSAN